MPGLKPHGSDIADDMSYGTGYPYKKPVYDSGIIAQSKKDYEEFGFDISKHALFADAENLPKMAETANKTDLEPPITETRDNTFVYHPDYDALEEAKEQQQQQNIKAIYSKEQCYNTKYGIISTGLDVRIFDNLSDEKLFWDFKETGELYFARGELQGNLDRMIDKFRQNKGGVYEDGVLTRNIKDHPETLAYRFLLSSEIFTAKIIFSNFVL